MAFGGVPTHAHNTYNHTPSSPPLLSLLTASPCPPSSALYVCAYHRAVLVLHGVTPSSPGGRVGTRTSWCAGRNCLYPYIHTQPWFGLPAAAHTVRSGTPISCCRMHHTAPFQTRGVFTHGTHLLTPVSAQHNTSLLSSQARSHESSTLCHSLTQQKVENTSLPVIHQCNAPQHLLARQAGEVVGAVQDPDWVLREASSPLYIAALHG